MIILDSDDEQWAGHYLRWNQGVDHPGKKKYKSGIKTTSICDRKKNPHKIAYMRHYI